MNRFKIRPLSHSQLSSFEYNPEAWYQSYILGIREEANPAMLFGNTVGDTLGTPTSMIPALIYPGVKEFALRANLGPIHLVGYCDAYCPDTKVLTENKTSATKDRWTQAKVDAHPQLTMYCLMLYLKDLVKPEEVTINLNFIPVRTVGFDFELPKPPKFQTFATSRTTRDILEYAVYIQHTVKLMEEYILNHG